MDVCFDLSQEAAHLSECYNGVHELISRQTVKDYVPYSWTSLILVKREYYVAMAHYYLASGLLSKEAAHLSTTMKDALEFLHIETATTQLKLKSPNDDKERKLLGEIVFLHFMLYQWRFHASYIIVVYNQTQMFFIYFLIFCTDVQKISTSSFLCCTTI